MPTEAGSSANTSVRSPTGQFYSVAFEMKLDKIDWGKSDKVHFKRASAALEEALRSDPAFAAFMEELIPGVRASVSDLGGGRRTPDGWIWHHDIREGIMQLVPADQHAPGSVFWATLHPGGKGGYPIWAVPAGAPLRKKKKQR